MSLPVVSPLPFEDGASPACADDESASDTRLDTEPHTVPHTGPDTGPDSGLYRRAMGRFATGVTVVTTRQAGHDHAMTASAVTSVSLEPLLMLVCVEQEARFHDAVLDAGVFGVSVLPAEARRDAEWLATRGRPLHGQLDRIAHAAGPATGVPLLTDALATFECRTTDAHAAGDHTIVVGRVLAVTVADHSGEALLYYRGRYGTLA